MKSYFKFYLAGCFLLHLVALASSTITRASYGEMCNSTRRCAKRDWLSCNESGVCGCLKPDIMIFEARNDLTAPVIAVMGTGKCATKVGERCRFSLGNSDGEGGSMFDTFPCVANSRCDSEGFCVCQDGFYEMTNSTCTRFQFYMQQCNEELKCSSDFQCIDNLCKCETANSLYDFRLGQCVGLAGGACLNQTCVENAACVSGSCVCKDGYFQNKQGSCSLQVGYGSSCTEDKHCGRELYSKSKLRCVEGKCDCGSDSVYGRVERSSANNNPNYYSSKYYGFDGNFRELCAAKVDKPCSDGYCAPNSYCSYTGSHRDYSRGVCKCVPGTVVSKSSGICGNQFGGSCAKSSECADGLVCISGKCSCYWDQTYKPEKKICENKVNAPCSSDDECDIYAECKKDATAGNGHCTCKLGYVVDGANGCRGTWNTSCSYETEQCDSLAGLKCVDKVCSCTRSSTYSFQHQKCVGLVGATCTSKDKADCTAHAACVYPRSPVIGRGDVTGFCTCNKGFTETEGYTCEANEEDNHVEISGGTSTSVPFEEETGSAGAQMVTEQSTPGREDLGSEESDEP